MDPIVKRHKVEPEPEYAFGVFGNDLLIKIILMCDFISACKLFRVNKQFHAMSARNPIAGLLSVMFNARNIIRLYRKRVIDAIAIFKPDCVTLQTGWDGKNGPAFIDVMNGIPICWLYNRGWFKGFKFIFSTSYLTALPRWDIYQLAKEEFIAFKDVPAYAQTQQMCLDEIAANKGTNIAYLRLMTPAIKRAMINNKILKLSDIPKDSITKTDIFSAIATAASQYALVENQTEELTLSALWINPWILKHVRKQTPAVIRKAFIAAMFYVDAKTPGDLQKYIDDIIGMITDESARQAYRLQLVGELVDGKLFLDQDVVDFMIENK